ncbi:MAG: SGNH/GDSL hydrolase family protein [Planctomycetota bacterium]
MRRTRHASRATVLALAFSALCPPALLTAADAKQPDPALRPIEDVAGLPRVLLLGDSISIGYTLLVRELLKGKANVHRPADNCGATEHGLKQLDKWLGDGKWDVIHFNFGLHDLKYLDEKGRYVTPDKGKQVAPLPVYEQNLRQLAARLKKTGAKLIWCSTTPVPEGSQGRVKGAEAEYNAAAEKVMKDEGVTVDDLHAYAAAHQAQIQLPKNVHFTEDGYKQLAAQVVASIEAQLGK